MAEPKENEITPAMIKVGEEMLWSFFGEDGMTDAYLREAAEDVFRAMSAKRPMTELARILRDYDLVELRGAEFQRLIRLAHTEGLLAAILRDIGFHGQAPSSQTSELGRESSPDQLMSLHAAVLL